MYVEKLKFMSSDDLTNMFRSFLFPAIAMVIFIFLWNVSASQVQTSLGQLPGPAEVYEQASNLVDEHFAERDKEVAFYQRQEQRNAKKSKKIRMRKSSCDLTPANQHSLTRYLPA